MSDTMRWRYGDMDATLLPVGAEVAIEIGDLVYRTAIAKLAPASKLPARHGEMLMLEVFAKAFAGVAMERSRLGDCVPIRVARAGVFEFDCEPATWAKNDMVGPAIVHMAGEACGELASQRVAKVLQQKFSIGKVAKAVLAVSETVLIDLGLSKRQMTERLLNFE